MALRNGSRHCPACDRQVLTHTQVVGGVAHIMHAFISLFTFGLWVIVWIIHAMQQHPERCAHCGRDIDVAARKKQRAEKAQAALERKQRKKTRANVQTTPPPLPGGQI